MAFDLVVIGTSLGGLSALKVLLAGLPRSFPLPVAIVQHRHRDSDEMISYVLRQHAFLPLKEVEDKDDINPGYVYIAPADYHLLVDDGYFSLSTDPPVSYARPSIDTLFESAAEQYGDRVVGVILTGANQDGAAGIAEIKTRGGIAIVQDPATAESPTMPEAALTSLRQLQQTPILSPSLSAPSHTRSAAVSVDWILPLPEIAPCLIKLCQPAPL